MPHAYALKCPYYLQRPTDSVQSVPKFHFHRSRNNFDIPLESQKAFNIKTNFKPKK